MGSHFRRSKSIFVFCSAWLFRYVSLIIIIRNVGCHTLVEGEMLDSISDMNTDLIALFRIYFLDLSRHVIFEAL